MENQQEEPRMVPEGRMRRIFRKTLIVLWRVSNKMMDAIEVNWAIIKRESDLFLGALLTLLGVFGFHSGKYCDGNTADYLSCTRPTTFYYYGWLEIICIIVGVFFILLWLQKRHK